MKFIFGVAAAALAASVPAAQPALTDDTQTSTSETKDRLPPERMEQLVERPIAVLKRSGLAASTRDFDALLDDAVRSHGQNSVEVADLLTSFGVELYISNIDANDPNVARASLNYLKRSIAAYRAAFGAKSPEVAVALNSYADADLDINGDAARSDAQAAMQEAYAIRLAALGADNAETKITADKLDNIRTGGSFTAANDDLKSITADARSVVASAALNSADSETLTISDVENGEFWKPQTHTDPLIDDFLIDAQRLQSANAASREAIANKYGLTIATLETTLDFLRKMKKDEFNLRRKAALKSEAVQLISSTNQAPIAIMLAAGAVSELSENGCSESDIAQLLNRSRDPDRDLWRVVSGCANSGAFTFALDQSSTARAALLYAAITWTNGDVASDLAASDFLLKPEFLALVAANQRDAIHADIARYKLTKLLDLGLLKEALAFGDSLSPEMRTLVLKGRQEKFRTTIAGFAYETPGGSSSPAIEYAAALALADRAPEARSVLDAVAPIAKLKRVRACLDEGASQDCGVADFGQNKVPLSALVVEQLLDEPNADPYVFVEATATGNSLSGATMGEALCRLLTQPAETSECQRYREADAQLRAPDQYDDENDRALWVAIGRVGGQQFAQEKASYAAKLAQLGVEKPESRSWTRISVDPAPLPFHEYPIPPAALTKGFKPSVAMKTLAPLPDGFTLVRADRSGNRVAAISISQRFDPDGEVTAGGYWLHLSLDRGKTWQRPLYTGLAEHFPYIVPALSRLPMIAGDRIHLEVEESLIDTASITYPPVATRIRRKRSGIYLDIPIDELRKDSDGDGIPDIAARHLLLDGSTMNDAPFIVGSDRDCSKQPSMEELARIEILKTLFRVQAQALIEPVGAKGFHFGKWRTTEPTSTQPIFMRGNPGDYRCLSVDRLMIVYPEADREKLRKFSPDFQLIELPAIYWNRDRSRGFMRWNMGWAGGTYRIIKNGAGWKLESISEWMS